MVNRSNLCVITKKKERKKENTEVQALNEGVMKWEGKGSVVEIFQDACNAR
jgi:hypothetical protein